MPYAQFPPLGFRPLAGKSLEKAEVYAEIEYKDEEFPSPCGEKFEKAL